ncbi:MAG: outer membrane beta-barrel protein [Pseudomonadota bacterium]
MTKEMALIAIIALAAPATALGQTAGDWTGGSVGGQIGYLDGETSGAASIDGDGATIGIRAHYDYDFGDYVIGGGIEFDSGDVDLGNGAASIDNVLRLKARAGIDAGQNWYYGTFGWAQASVGDPADAIGDSDGYFLGLGAEVTLSDRATAGAEILYHNFDDFDLGGLEADATTLNFSVNFRF